MRFSAVPRSLTSRLVVTAVALVALVSVLVASLSTLAMRNRLTSQKDAELTRASSGAVRIPDRDDRGSGGGPPVGFDNLTYHLVGGARPGDGVLGDDGERKPVGASTLRELRSLKVDGEPETIRVGQYGHYRVRVLKAPDGDVVAVGLPMRDVEDATGSLLAQSLMLALAGVGLAALLGLLLVRRQLRPLREVAATAYDVTAMPLDAGGQTIETRVPEQYTDPFTEVGQVGSALNTLLDHVDSALESRHQSEQQVRQFVADASHELRTPLSTIHGYAELSRRTPDDAEMLSQAMGKVETEATRMSALVGDLLLLARLDSGRPLEREEVDLTRLLLEAVADAKVVAPGHVWRLDLPEEPVTVVGDEQRLHQVVTNLINNARRHTPAGTTVTVGARPRPAEGEHVQITVHDDGPGIPAALQGRVFERFTRGDTSRTRSSGGAGLGLSLVQAITEAHGGNASISSAPGDTTFTISLP